VRHVSRTGGALVQTASPALTTTSSTTTCPSRSSGQCLWHGPPAAAISRRGRSSATRDLHNPDEVRGHLSSSRVLCARPTPLDWSPRRCAHARVGPGVPVEWAYEAGLDPPCLTRPGSTGRGQQEPIGRPLVADISDRAACEYGSRRHGRDVCGTAAQWLSARDAGVQVIATGKAPCERGPARVRWSTGQSLDENL
jgi:hypothetical protein